MPELPFIDEHSRVIDASQQVTWGALRDVATGAFSTPATGVVSRLLGCEETQAAGEQGSTGSTIPGFRVERSEPPRELGLSGRHRFSRYELNFRVEPVAGGESRVTAETRAAFPGLAGKAYRAAVIGTRGHVLVTTNLLRSIARRAGSIEAGR